MITYSQSATSLFVMLQGIEVWDVLSELFLHAMERFCCYFKDTAMVF